LHIVYFLFNVCCSLTVEDNTALHGSYKVFSPWKRWIVRHPLKIRAIKKAASVSEDRFDFS